MMYNITMVAGARPNFIKLAPIVWAVDKAKESNLNICCKLVYVGKEDDPTLESSLFCDLQIPRPDVFLGVDCEGLNELTGQVMGAFDRYLNEVKTDAVIVVDDLASTMAVAIVCKKRGVTLAHLVAGTRSFDFTMPKEVNRLVIDGLSDLLFTAGEGASSIVSREGAELQKVYMVGNILIDTLRHNYNRFTRPQCLDSLNIVDGSYIVFTINRKALLSNIDYLKQMIDAISLNVGDTKVIAPLRGLAHDTIAPLVADRPNFHLVDSMSYLDFGYLTAHARGIVTDSGNVAEEATFNNVPCITLNDYTEHIETVSQGTNVLVGSDIEKLLLALEGIISNNWKVASLPERWDGRTADRILKIICSSC
ncbi:MAG: UDP-N-acetyl glucosamine 2-epimerase [Prevotella sp.]